MEGEREEEVVGRSKYHFVYNTGGEGVCGGATMWRVEDKG